MIKTPSEDTFYGTPPSKFKISSFRPLFFMVLMQSGVRNPDCKGAFLENLRGAQEGNRVEKVILYSLSLRRNFDFRRQKRWKN